MFSLKRIVSFFACGLLCIYSQSNLHYATDWRTDLQEDLEEQKEREDAGIQLRESEEDKDEQEGFFVSAGRGKVTKKPMKQELFQGVETAEEAYEQGAGFATINEDGEYDTVTFGQRVDTDDDKDEYNGYSKINIPHV